MSPATPPAPDAPGAAADRLLPEAEFARVRRLIYELAGIVIEPQKRQMVHARLSRRLRTRGIASFAAYLDRIERGRDPEDVQDFVNAITTNLTSFFREAHHFEHFRAHVLARRKPAARLRVWSAGCSSGEEPYSIALSALAAPTPPPRDFRILASDLDTAVLERARAGVYPLEKAGPALAPYARLVETDKAAGTVRIGAEARALVAFRQLNLVRPWPMRGPFDAIFCRNVLIYFDAETKADLLARFAAMLRPGGFLYLGHSESILGDHALLASEGQTTYRRRA